MLIIIMYFGLPLKYIAKLQLVQNASARVISKNKKKGSHNAGAQSITLDTHKETNTI